MESEAARILVVEDEVLIRALLADELREAGCTVIEAATADDALAYLDSGGAVDLVFSDVLMPGSLDGVELARRLRQRDPLLPVILSSGYPGSVNVERAGPFIRKPYHLDHAIAVILGQLDQRRARRSR